jgi:putative oxidoreductase
MALDSLYTQWAPRLLSVLRIIAAFLFIAHGSQKLLGYPPSPPPPTPPPAQAAQQTPPQPRQTPWYVPVAGVLELVGGLLLLLGLFTRPVAFILSGFMAVAYFMAHAPENFFPVNNQGDSAILYCFIFLYFFFAGGGAWSIDAARRGTGLATP